MAYFDNEAARGLWNMAAAKLRSSALIVIIGYSLLEMDLLVTDLLRLSLSPGVRGVGSTHPVEVIDRTENGSHGMTVRLAAHPQRDGTPAITGVPVARAEGLEPPTF